MELSLGHTTVVLYLVLSGLAFSYLFDDLSFEGGTPGSGGAIDVTVT